MIGMKIGRLSVFEYAGTDKNRKAYWICRCDCGKDTVVEGSRLRNGTTNSCGCLQKETASAIAMRYNSSDSYSAPNRRIHGENKKPLHRVWCQIRSRCRNKENRYYGGRGIKVCKEWDEDYIAFRAWALKNGYQDGLEIDRIDVNGDYCPDNCRWVTRKEQVRNRRNTVKLTIGTETKPLIQWCEEKGFDYRLAICRYERGFTPEEIFDTPGTVIRPRPMRRVDITPKTVCELMNKGYTTVTSPSMLNFLW